MKKVRTRKAGKKGAFIASGLIDLFSVIIMVLIAVIFMILSYNSNAQVSLAIRSESGRINGEAAFLNFLRTPIRMDDGRYMTPMELVPLANYQDEQDSYRTKLAKELSSFIASMDFNAYPKDVCRLRLEILKDGNPIGGDMTAEKIGPWTQECFEIYYLKSSMAAPVTIGSKSSYEIVFSMHNGKVDSNVLSRARVP